MTIFGPHRLVVEGMGGADRRSQPTRIGQLTR
jgi:hypothetical protein